MLYCRTATGRHSRSLDLCPKTARPRPDGVESFVRVEARRSLYGGAVLLSSLASKWPDTVGEWR
jgi:hypothetical protein